MKRSLVALTVLCSLFLTSCMDIETSQQLERISSMTRTIDSVETVFKEQKLDTLSVLSLHAYTVENRIKNNYHSDTLNLELGRKMDAFKVMRRNLKPLGQAHGFIPKGITELRTKLGELKSDIENGNGKREKYEEFVVFEEEKVAQLRTHLNEYIETKESVLKTYNEYHKELNDFSLSVLKK